MGIEAQPKPLTETAPAAPPPASPPSPPTLSPAQQEPTKVDLPAVQVDGVARTAAHVPTRRLITETDDDIPDNAELIEMSPKALKSRLDRFTKKQIKERFGVEDFDAVKTQLDRLADYERKEEEQRLAQLTEVDRLKEQLAQAHQARERAETRAQELHETQVVAAEDRRIKGIADKYIKPKGFKIAISELASFLNGCSEDDLRSPDELIDNWFQKFVKEDWPEFSKDYGAQAPVAPQAPAPPPRAIPLSNGAHVERPSTQHPSGQVLQKTAAPGKSNSMSETEVREYKRQNGLHW